MEPSNPTPTDSDKEQKHAEALAQMAALDYKLAESHKPEQKHFISKKVLIYLAISAVVSIISLIVMAIASRNNTPTQDTQQTDQLLDTLKEVKDLQNDNR
jgi:hypothetical protein